MKSNFHVTKRARDFHNVRAAVFVDVDDTLVLWVKGKPLLNERLVDRIRESQGELVEFVLWSARGRRYAQAIAEQFGVADLFCAVVGKPTSIFDDQGRAWMGRIKVNTLEEFLNG